MAGPTTFGRKVLTLRTYSVPISSEITAKPTYVLTSAKSTHCMRDQFANQQSPPSAAKSTHMEKLPIKTKLLIKTCKDAAPAPDAASVPALPATREVNDQIIEMMSNAVEINNATNVTVLEHMMAQELLQTHGGSRCYVCIKACAGPI